MKLGKSKSRVALVTLLFVASVWASAQSPVFDSGDTPYLVVLGTVQDAGSPQAACAKTCCAHLWRRPDTTRRVSCLGLVDPAAGTTYLFDGTPDMPRQLRHLARVARADSDVPDGVFLTHAHIGHYTGLMHFGREAIGARGVPVYAMPRLDTFLRSNGPWEQLVSLGNIELRTLADGVPVALDSSARLTVTPLRVPHRDEYSETVGFRVSGPNKSALFIPDVDKWARWQLSLVDQLAQVDYAYLDATFYDGTELPGRDMSQIPHPSVAETMGLLDALPAAERRKVRFIHLNHTNPLLVHGSPARAEVRVKGYRVAEFGETVGL